MIARRAIPITGEVHPSSYDEGRYNVSGNDIREVLTDLQREVFAFVARPTRAPSGAQRQSVPCRLPVAGFLARNRSR